MIRKAWMYHISHLESEHNKADFDLDDMTLLIWEIQSNREISASGILESPK